MGGIQLISGCCQDNPKVKVIKFIPKYYMSGGRICKNRLFFRTLLLKMASDQSTPVKEQRVVVKLLVATSKNTEIHYPFSCAFGKQTVTLITFLLH